jgi:tRNA threonylcarbamoyladenosine biosynthesis protein TsaB
MLTLALETSGDVCSVALRDVAAERDIASYAFRHGRHLTERLPGIVAFVLADSGSLSLSRDIDALAVGLGPGSFTGVRVAVTMMKTWAWALQKPIVGVSSLDALAWPLLCIPNVAVAAVAPTRRGEVVAAFYAANHGPTPLAPPAVVANAGVVAAARQAIPGERRLIVVGEAADAVRLATPPNGLADIVWITEAATAANVVRAATTRLLAGDFDDADGLVPLYVTPSPVGA